MQALLNLKLFNGVHCKQKKKKLSNFLENKNSSFNNFSPHKKKEVNFNLSVKGGQLKLIFQNFIWFSGFRKYNISCIFYLCNNKNRCQLSFNSHARHVYRYKLRNLYWTPKRFKRFLFFFSSRHKPEFHPEQSCILLS